MSAIRQGRGCPFLQTAVKKHGEAAFTFQVLIICFDEDVFKYEKEYIMKYNTMIPNGYNVAEGGKSGRNFLGKTHTEEVRKKIGEKSKEYHSRPEVKEAYRQIMIRLNEKRKSGVMHEKWIESLKNANLAGKSKKGIKVKDEVKQKISEGLKQYYKNNKDATNDSFRKKHSDILRKARGKKVSQFSKENVFIASYDSIAEAAEKTKLSKGGIQSAAIGRIKSCGGFIWKKTEPKESLSV